MNFCGITSWVWSKSGRGHCKFFACFACTRSLEPPLQELAMPLFVLSLWFCNLCVKDTSLQQTKFLNPTCPLLWGSTVVFYKNRALSSRNCILKPKSYLKAMLNTSPWKASPSQEKIWMIEARPSSPQSWCRKPKKIMKGVASWVPHCYEVQRLLQFASC